MSNKATLHLAPTAYNVMAKPIGPICNMDCTYCYYLEKKKLYPDSGNFKMSYDTLENYVKQYIQSQNVPVVNFVWQGGEPTLLGIDFFEKVIEFQNRYAGKKSISNSFQTNGTLITDDWCRFFRKHNFLIGVSVDGPKHLHDPYRPTNRNTPTFDDVMRGIKLLKEHRVEFNTLTVVNKYNAQHPLEVYNFLKDIGSQYLQFIPIVERRSDKLPEDGLELVSPTYKGKAQVTEWSVEPLQFGRFLCSVFDEWVRKDVGKTYVQIFDVTLANWIGEMPGLCVFDETCGQAIVMEHNGDLYSCDHFVYPEYHIGNINDGPVQQIINSEKQQKFGRDKLDKLPGFCMECEYRFACHGECPKHRFEYTPDGEPGLNYLCKSYKMFFSHVHPYMQFMGDELNKKRAPANVMDWVRRMDARNQGIEPNARINIGRNDPCPCGSGKKYKNCCINITKY